MSCFGLAAGGEFQRSELADRLEQAVTHRAGSVLGLNKALVHKRVEMVQNVEPLEAGGAAHRFGCIEIEAAREDRKLLEDVLLGIAEEQVGPLDQRQERLLAG